jgi:2-methoxy-6-polyprenyl-1,4-benzoquinol methylase
MNDFMSMGIHRYWKNYFVDELGNLCPEKVYTHEQSQKTRRVLDVAGGTGDISFKIL